MFPSLKPLLCSVALLVAGPAAGRALDFTPRFIEVNLDGGPVNSLYIQSGRHKILLTQPNQWTISGGGARLEMILSSLPQANVSLGNALVSLPDKPDDAWLDSTQTQLLKALPRDAANATVLEKTAQPYNINNWKSYAWKLAYDLYGVRYSKSVCLIKISPTETVELIALSRENDFAQVRSVATKLITSWMVLPTSASKPPVGGES